MPRHDRASTSSAKPAVGGDASNAADVASASLVVDDEKTLAVKEHGEAGQTGHTSCVAGHPLSSSSSSHDVAALLDGAQHGLHMAPGGVAGLKTDRFDEQVRVSRGESIKLLLWPWGFRLLQQNGYILHPTSYHANTERLEP